MRRKAQTQGPPPGLGYFHRLPWQEQHALYEYTRRNVRPMRVIDRLHNAEHAAYVKSKTKTRSQEELAALITEYGFGLSFFERWQQRGVRTVSSLNAKLKQLGGAEGRNARERNQERCPFQIWQPNYILLLLATTTTTTTRTPRG